MGEIYQATRLQRTGRLASLLLFWFLNSCSPPSAGLSNSLKDYNLVLIMVDALRADHLGCYGYWRQTSPFIDSLADRGVLFERALSNSSYTRESLVPELCTAGTPEEGCAARDHWATPENMG